MEFQNQGESLLAKLALQTVSLQPDTPIEDIIQFRIDYGDELGRFRVAIGKLAKQIDPDTQTIEALQQQVRDIYLNEIEPAVNGLSDALNRGRIRSTVVWITTVLFTGTINFLSKDTTMNLFASSSATIAATGVNYALDRAAQLAKDPYSFVLSAERTF